MNILTTKSLSAKQKEYVLELWNDEYPKSLQLNNMAALDSYLATLSTPSHYFAEVQEVLVGWFVDFQRGNKQWFAMIIARQFHGQGLGSRMLSDAKSRHKKLYGWVIDKEKELRSDGSLYPSPLQFYLNNDFTVNPEVRLETPEISAVQIEWNQSD